MKLLAFAASNSRQSINKNLVNYASQLVEAEVELLDLNDFEMPIYSSDKENEHGIHPLAESLYEKISQSDAILISFAEHNGSYTSAYKNIFDWMSRINQKVFQNKAMVLLASSPGPGGAKNVLNSAVTSAPYFAGDVKGSLSIPSFYDNFDMQTGKVSNQEANQELESIMQKLVA
ncbi:NADPH-dependent FMN reductase [Paraglaciecola sp.]|uniref:NADPH-dependent FMN reductase n=1 Tax=Paraglaciecola sp. TaxID=1920173 RepID=UPI003EF5D62D